MSSGDGSYDTLQGGDQVLLDLSASCLLLSLGDKFVSQDGYQILLVFHDASNDSLEVITDFRQKMRVVMDI